MSKESEKVSMTISDGEGNARAHFDSIEEFEEAAEKAIDNLKANQGVIGEAPDYSDYTEYWTIPKKVLAKRLTEPKSIRIVKNGVEGWLDGEAGHIHVVEISGGQLKETMFASDEFQKKFERLAVQTPLFSEDED
jgi:hypothetical protein